MTDRLGG